MDYRYDAFISFAWKDLARARKLHEQLSARGYVTWYAEKDTRAGDNLGPVIEKGLVRSRYFFVLHTKYYDGNAGWAARELEWATTDETRSGVKKIVVLKYDQAPLFNRLEGKVYVDFTDRRRNPLDQLRRCSTRRRTRSSAGSAERCARRPTSTRSGTAPTG